MRFLKRHISLFLIIFVFIQPLSYAEETLQPTQRSVGYINFLKKTAKVLSAISAAFGVHILTELPIVVTHEYGHHLGNRLTGGKGGKIDVESNLHKHPLAVLMPFFAEWGSPEKNGNQLATTISGPLIGIGTNYTIMAGANSIYTLKNGGSKKEMIKAGLTSPLRAYTDVSDEISRMIVEQGNYSMRSFSEIFMITFNLLKSSKMFGEFLYGLTPISTKGGDGQKVWQELGFKKDFTVSAWTGLMLGCTPALVAVSYGIAKGVYLRLKNNDATEIR